MTLVAYVSGHGFGHATRTAEVLRALRDLRPELPVTVVTPAPRRLFEGPLAGGFEHRRIQCDVGLAQIDALRIDEAGTLEAWREFQQGWPARVDGEARFLRDSGARLVLGDIPPLAFAAATAASVPAVGLANFSWDWIYAHLAKRDPQFIAPAESAAEAYRGAQLLLRLPFAGDTSSFPAVEDIPLVARQPRGSREQLRARLGLDGRTAVLVSFGGVGLRLPLERLRWLSSFQFLLSGDSGQVAPNVRIVGDADLRRLGWSYAELVGCADVVVSKPGYGIVSDAVGAGARLVYTDRGDFPEYDVLVEAMPRYLPVTYVAQADLRAGRIEEALERVMALDTPALAPPTHGAEVAAEHLARLL